jgi:hypothetical protein
VRLPNRCPVCGEIVPLSMTLKHFALFHPDRIVDDDFDADELGLDPEEDFDA